MNRLYNVYNGYKPRKGCAEKSTGLADIINSLPCRFEPARLLTSSYINQE